MSTNSCCAYIKFNFSETYKLLDPTEQELQNLRNAECPVCLESLKNVALVIFSCGHVACEACESEWYERKNKDILDVSEKRCYCPVECEKHEILFRYPKPIVPIEPKAAGSDPAKKETAPLEKS